MLVSDVLKLIIQMFLASTCVYLVFNDAIYLGLLIMYIIMIIDLKYPTLS